DDSQLAQIAGIITRYEFVALQEVKDTVVLDRLMDLLPGWNYICSDPVGIPATDRYAFLYKDSELTVLGSPYIYGDPVDMFLTEPFVAHFRSGDFDFTAVTVQLNDGGTIAEIQMEAALLDDVLGNTDGANSFENDVILMGSFNLPPDDSFWEIGTHTPLVSAETMTTIDDTGSSDNIWINTVETTEGDQSIFIYAFDDTFTDDAAASLAVSDHRPVSTYIETGSDDDGEGDWNSGAFDKSSGLEHELDGDVRISSVTATPTESESVSITNHSFWSVDLTLWTLGDINNQEHYNIPIDSFIGAGETITYINTQLPFVINDTGETIYLKNNGILKDSWSN
ncbi:MAG: lamin tail domain-containing protein, partial [Spirochaetales bacterium]|nr:lamin tail domain-containing protein [Spirochaetales bacterium]